MDHIDTMELTADPQTTTPNNCTCTSICRCGIDYSDCDPGNPISWWPSLNTAIGEVRDWCYTGRELTFIKSTVLKICKITFMQCYITIMNTYY